MADRVALYLQDAHSIQDGIKFVQYAESRNFEAVWQAETSDDLRKLAADFEAFKKLADPSHRRCLGLIEWESVLSGAGFDIPVLLSRAALTGEPAPTIAKLHAQPRFRRGVSRQLRIPR